MSTCLPCDLERADAADIVYRDDTWACEVADGYDAPGWFILRLRRHAEGWAQLTPDEAAGFGFASQRVIGAIQAATDAPTVYVMSFGENYPHFHFLVIARPAGLAPELKGAGILSQRAAWQDRDAARRTATAVRKAAAS